MPKIKITDKTQHGPFNFRIKEEQRKNIERRKINRRKNASDRRKQWISTVKPTQGADGYYYIEYPQDYHVAFLRGQRERRKILRYYHKGDGYLCITERRSGIERRNTPDRRGDKFKVEPVTESDAMHEIPGYAQLKKIAMEIDAAKKKKGL